METGERESVTAEFALVLPAALVCLAFALGTVQAGGQQLRLLDAAAVEARLLGRGEDPADGAVPGRDRQRSVQREAGLVCVTLTARSTVIGLGAAGVQISGRACALDEQAMSIGTEK